MKIVLLNPPGEGRNHLRDYYCAGITKALYYYHPVDLVYLSGLLAVEHSVKVVDSIARKLGPEETIERILAWDPDVAVVLVSAPTFEADHAFLEQLRRRRPGLRLIGTGDVYRELRESLFERQQYLEASLVDFSTEDLLVYLRGPGGRPINNIVYRHDGGLVVGPEVHAKGTFSLPLPIWEEFPPHLYSLPIARREPFMTVLTDFGCPYQCTFCPMSTINFKVRPIEEVLRELKALRERGYREIHFRDQTFGVDKERTLELCRRMKDELPELSWTCFSRVDVMDEERLRAMANSGCHTIIFGIEFDQDLLYKEMKKNITRSQLFETIKLSRSLGIRTAGEFIIGLPDQTAGETLATGELAVLLGLDFASFNLAMPRMGTPWRKELVAAGKADAEEWRADTLRGSHAWRGARMSREEVLRLRRRIERRFYLRPRYILRQLSNIRTWTQLKLYAYNGAGIVLGANKQ